MGRTPYFMQRGAMIGTLLNQQGIGLKNSLPFTGREGRGQKQNQGCQEPGRHLPLKQRGQ